MQSGALLDALDDQLRRTMEGPAWHGPSMREALDGLGANEASQHPIAGAHSCWEIVLHLSGTYRLVLRRLQGQDAALKPDEDWPPMPAPSEQNWARDINTLYELNAELRARLKQFPVERLYAPLVQNPPYPAFTQFFGLTQHDLYHAGQIVLLKRALHRA